MNQTRISSWNQLNDELYAHSWKEPLGRFRSNFAFRGMTRATEDLTTTLYRLGGAYERSEVHLLRNFRKYAHKSAALGDSVWNWLSLAQHHGLPSRLLDWTFSPFVAMHFATQNLDRYDLDGIIWCVDYLRAHQLLPPALKKVLREEHADVFTTEMLERVTSTLPHFDRLSRQGEFVIFIDPPSLDDRIVNQFALLSMMSSPSVQLDAWLLRHPDLYRRIIIPAELKWEIRDKLDQANITERVLFPGLDGLSRWLKRYYSPRTDRTPPPIEEDRQSVDPHGQPDARDQARRGRVTGRPKQGPKRPRSGGGTKGRGRKRDA
jgi:hypothetical protein